MTEFNELYDRFCEVFDDSEDEMNVNTVIGFAKQAFNFLGFVYDENQIIKCIAIRVNRNINRVNCFDSVPLRIKVTASFFRMEDKEKAVKLNIFEHDIHKTVVEYYNENKETKHVTFNSNRSIKSINFGGVNNMFKKTFATPQNKAAQTPVNKASNTISNLISQPKAMQNVSAPMRSSLLINIKTNNK